MQKKRQVRTAKESKQAEGHILPKECKEGNKLGQQRKCMSEGHSLPGGQKGREMSIHREKAGGAHPQTEEFKCREEQVRTVKACE